MKGREIARAIVLRVRATCFFLAQVETSILCRVMVEVGTRLVPRLGHDFHVVA